jgi:hypothetical protein
MKSKGLGANLKRSSVDRAAWLFREPTPAESLPFARQLLTAV